jgi:hypothetical protein
LESEGKKEERGDEEEQDEAQEVALKTGVWDWD